MKQKKAVASRTQTAFASIVVFSVVFAFMHPALESPKTMQAAPRPSSPLSYGPRHPKKSQQAQPSHSSKGNMMPDSESKNELEDGQHNQKEIADANEEVSQKQGVANPKGTRAGREPAREQAERMSVRGREDIAPARGQTERLPSHREADTEPPRERRPTGRQEGKVEGKGEGSEYTSRRGGQARERQADGRRGQDGGSAEDFDDENAHETIAQRHDAVAVQDDEDDFEFRHGAGGDDGVQGMYKLSESVFEDPFYRNYPSEDSIAVRNANFLVEAVQAQFTFDGFEVFDNDELVGIMPAFYIGFTRCGLSAVYGWLKEMLPCMLPLNKEGSHWLNSFLPACDVDDEGLITSCSPTLIHESFITVVGRQGKALPLLDHVSPSCKHKPFIVTAAANLWRQFMSMNFKLPAAKRIDVAVDLPTFLKALTPRARMIGLYRQPAELLRSYYWFFTTKSMDEYQQNLQHHAAILQDDLNRGESRCELLSSDARFLEHPNIASFPSSCTLLRWVKVFGADSVWITDGYAVTECRDSLLAWMGDEFTEGVECRAFQPNVKKNVDRRHYPDDVAALELEIVDLLKNYHPLVPLHPQEVQGRARGGDAW